MTANIGGGFLGVGPAELVVIAGVGWLLLGPTKLYALAKDSGRVVGELRKAANEARQTFTDAIELELEEDQRKESLQKAENESVDIPLKEEHGEENTNSVITKSDFPDPESNESDNPSPPSSISVANIVTENEVVLPSLEKKGPPAETEIGASPQFLEQIRRAADPNQVAPSEDVPDLDMTVEFEENEVERLEREYREAKARLEEKRSERNYLKAKESLENKRAELSSQSSPSEESQPANDQPQQQPESKSSRT